MRSIHAMISPVLASMLLLVACTSSGPDKTEWEIQLRLILPYFEVNDVKIEGTASIGDNASPAYKSRFSASITPKQPLYTEAGIEQDVRLIRETLPMGSKTKIFGVAVSTKRGDGWSTDISFEDLPIGKHRGEFVGANYVKGSAEADAAIKATIAAKQAEQSIREKALGLWHGKVSCVKLSPQNFYQVEMDIVQLSEKGNFSALLKYAPNWEINNSIQNASRFSISGYIGNTEKYPTIDEVRSFSISSIVSLPFDGIIGRINLHTFDIFGITNGNLCQMDLRK
jgi:hypothetical protein